MILKDTDSGRIRAIFDDHEEDVSTPYEAILLAHGCAEVALEMLEDIVAGVIDLTDVQKIVGHLENAGRAVKEAQYLHSMEDTKVIKTGKR